MYNYAPGPSDPEADEAGVTCWAFITTLIWLRGLFCEDADLRVFVWYCFAGFLGTFIISVASSAYNARSTFRRELICALCYRLNWVILFSYLWPLVLGCRVVFTLVNLIWGPLNFFTYSDCVETDVRLHLEWEHRGLRRDWVANIVDGANKRVSKEIDESLETIDEKLGELGKLPEVAARTAVPAMAAVGLAVSTPAHAAKPLQPSALEVPVEEPLKLNLTIFGDTTRDHDIFVNARKGDVAAVGLHVTDANNEPILTHVGVGKSFKALDGTVTSTIGPEYSWATRTIARITNFNQMFWKAHSWTLAWTTKFAWGIDLPTSIRSLQFFHHRSFPKWLTLRHEESWLGGTFDNWYLGPEIDIRGKGGASYFIFPYWDVGRQRTFDVQVGLSLSF